ncbi:MAG: alpha-rhamnosidase, partial [Prevotellaceae bacterium]|nr:alpha-rhamnosidase [Prevotellaceae bacterium]
MKKTFLLLFTAMMIQSCLFAGKSDLVLQSLTCEYAHDPSGIDVPNPALGWQIVSERQAVNQSAYRIIVSDSPEALKRNRGDVWDSGKVPSPKSQQVRYAGPELRTAQYYYWKVQIWDGQGNASAWSEPAHWS